MTPQFTHDTYLSPFTWRYGTNEMRQIWSVANKRRLWRRIWVALAEAQRQAGLVTQAQVDDLRAQQENIDIDRAHELEKELRHDLMAEVHTFAEQCTVGGGIIHLGATSMDVIDNADALRLREALAIIEQKLGHLLKTLADKIEAHANDVSMGFTHIQPAEPTTIGYRLAFYAQDLLESYIDVVQMRQNIRGKGLKGAVGTSASYEQLLNGTKMTPRQLEQIVMDQLELEAYEIASQTYPRSQDWRVLNVLAGIAMTVHKFAFDVRLLQTPPIGEWNEPFGTRQIGSSAMPFKRNPINAENMNSLARYLATLPRVMWDNAANSLLERTLDDSGNRRTVLPEGFLAADELLKRTQRVLDGLRIDEQAVKRNLEIYGIFAATERLLMEAVRQGGDRQDLHEVIRQHSLMAWEAMRNGQPNPLMESLAQDATMQALLSPEEIKNLLNANEHIGDAPERALNIAKAIRETIIV